eukprot:TRINITY_DN57690_c0_g1_i1.p1 TRINITY_DN57690_c0_g1~~TRINITY_DN57690_c0_g1_i1.p1  ORF type:complete len:133 (-),score=30.52 TRINITY_DN57690_c0_g1_i1:227-625(-)
MPSIEEFDGIVAGIVDSLSVDFVSDEDQEKKARAKRLRIQSEGNLVADSIRNVPKSKSSPALLVKHGALPKTEPPVTQLFVEDANGSLQDAQPMRTLFRRMEREITRSIQMAQMRKVLSRLKNPAGLVDGKE